MNYPFKGGRAVDASEKIFGASLDACWYHALLGLIQASGLAGGYDYLSVFICLRTKYDNIFPLIKVECHCIKITSFL